MLRLSDTRAAPLLMLLVAMQPAAHAATFSVRLPQAGASGRLPASAVLDGFGCEGLNRSPELTWTKPPAATKSLAVTMFDRDAPTGSGWWHWTVFNLPAELTSLPEGAGSTTSPALPSGAVQGRTDFGKSGFGGACPPAGARPHRYAIAVWALDTPALPLDASAPGAMVGFFLRQHALGKAEVVLRHGR